MYRRREVLAGLSGIAVTAGCLGGTDDCYRWGLSFSSETAVERSAEELWIADGDLRALFSGSSSIERPYEAVYSDVEVLVLSDGEVVGKEWVGDVSVDDGERSDSDCIDTLVVESFVIAANRPPTRITADCAEFHALCEHGDDVREYVYEGDPSESPEPIEPDTWDNRARPCEEPIE